MSSQIIKFVTRNVTATLHINPINLILDPSRIIANVSPQEQTTGINVRHGFQWTVPSKLGVIPVIHTFDATIATLFQQVSNKHPKVRMNRNMGTCRESR